MASQRRIHVIGAGLAGLSAALHLALVGENVTVYEAAPYAGGRCRSYMDRALGCRIDNGTHLVLSGNDAINDYLSLVQNPTGLVGPSAALFPFMDLADGMRWTVRLGSGRVPLGLLRAANRVPGTRVLDYLQILRLGLARTHATLTDVLPSGPLTTRLWEPLALAALNTVPEEASARLFANVLRQSLLRGAPACRPRTARVGLSETFVLPCLNVLRQREVPVLFGHRLRALDLVGPVVRRLDFGTTALELAPTDWVVLAVPAWVAADLIPGLVVPDSFRSILNVHYRATVPPESADGNVFRMTGLLGGLAEWVFARAEVISVTVSAADRYASTDQDELAQRLWQDIARLYDLDPAHVPPYRLIHEKRATFAATPAQDARRPRAWAGWSNMALAGDWTATGLPSTLEGAIRSGMRAAEVVIRWKP